MRVEDELRGAFREITAGPLPVRIDLPDVERAARRSRARHAAAAGGTAVLVAALVALPAVVLRRSGPAPIAHPPVVMPRNVVVADETHPRKTTTVAILATPDGPVREHGVTDRLPDMASVGGSVVAHSVADRLVRVTADGYADIGPAYSWAPARDRRSVWRVYRRGGATWLERTTLDGISATAPRTVPDGLADLVGEVSDGLVAVLSRPVRPGDLREDVTHTPPKTHTTDVVLLRADGTQEMLAENASAHDVRGEYAVVSARHDCFGAAQCGDYRLDLRTRERTPLPSPPATTRSMWQLSPDGRYAAVQVNMETGQHFDTGVDPYEVYVLEIATGSGDFVANSRSDGMRGLMQWTDAGTLTWIVRRAEEKRGYLAWWGPGMAAARVGTAAVGQRFKVGGEIS